MSKRMRSGAASGGTDGCWRHGRRSKVSIRPFVNCVGFPFKPFTPPTLAAAALTASRASTARMASSRATASRRSTSWSEWEGSVTWQEGVRVRSTS